MANTVFDPGKVLGIKIKELSRRELCELACRLCDAVKEDVGAGGYRGGIYPENISLDNEGNVALGKAKSSNWGESELGFLAPELFWKGEKSSAADVYSIGMLLYYAANGGRLPFVEAGGDDVSKGMAQQKRMNGESFAPPVSAGRRLGDIISKATKFSPHERYQSMDELKAVLESCVKNLYLKGAPSAETIFKKSDDELSAVERMMISIIEKEDSEAEKPVAPQQEEEPEAVLQEPVSDETQPEVQEAEAEAALEPEEDVRVYVPEKTEEKTAQEPRQEYIPVLTEEENPELAPVQPERQPVVIPAVQYGKSMERERKINEEMKKRKRRPVVIILVLCALLIVAAIVFNAVMKDRNAPPEPTPTAQGDVIFAPEATPTPEPTPSPEPTPEPGQPVESTYELIIEDVSWTQARDKCMQMGGHLAVVSTAEEFNKIVELAEENGVRKVWLGCHRIDGQLVWETTETVEFYQWAANEPSGYDWGDNVPEDYLLLWYHNGWYYNDSRNDPVSDYPEMYRGQIAYVCEFDGR